MYITAGGVVNGFTGHAWYTAGPTFHGLAVVPTLEGVIVGAAVLDLVYRAFPRPRKV